MTSLTQVVARYCVDQDERVPSAAMDMAKRVLLDELGCMVLGRRLPPGRLIADYVSTFGGRDEAAVVGVPGLRVPSPLAALANGTSSHADELDGSHVTEGHPGASIVASALAIAEAHEASGTALLAAIVLGYDIGTRLVDAAGGRRRLIKDRHVHSDFLHAYAVAAGCGALLQLSAEEMRHALALAATWSPATPAVFFGEKRHMSKALNCGVIAHAGISAALLARRGFEGHEEVLEAPDGLADVWMDGEPPVGAFADLGQRYAIQDTNFKFFSAGYPIHAPLRAALDLMQGHGLAPADIVDVEVRMTTNSAEIVDRRAMPSICIQDMLSVGMVHGKLGFEEAHDDSLRELAEVRRLREAIVVVADPELDAENPRGRGAKVRIRTAAGAEHARAQPYPPGHCRAGDATWDALAAKFVSSVSGFWSAGEAEAVVRIVGELDAHGDVEALVAACDGAARG